MIEQSAWWYANLLNSYTWNLISTELTVIKYQAFFSKESGNHNYYEKCQGGGKWYKTDLSGKTVSMFLN